MPDDKPADPNKPADLVKKETGAVPPIDVEALAAQLDSRIKAGIAEAVGNLRPNDSGAQPTHDPNVGKPAVDPLGEMVRGYVAPEVNRIAIQAEAAADLATFYTSGSEDELEWRRANKDEVEKVFTQMLKAGRPMSRGDIANWVKGKDTEKTSDFFTKRKTARQDRAAVAGADAGGTGGRPPATQTGKDPHEMNEEELGKTVAGHTF